MGVNTSFIISREESKKQSIKPKGMGVSSVIGGRSVDMTAFEREEAYRENERTVKKLMVEVSRLQSFMKALLENYSLPENLQEDIKEMIYVQEMTHYDNNNDFFA